MLSFDGKWVLNAGSGPKNKTSLHPSFRNRDWEQMLLDADANAAPDILGDIADLRGKIDDGAFDAVWCSHALEHVYAHEALAALREFRRVLRADGFALVTCPDIRAVAELIVAGRFSEPIYQSPAGPIRAGDMLWGHQKSIAAGATGMAHKCGYTADSLGELLIEAGFDEAWVLRGEAYDLWAVGLREDANASDIRLLLQRGGLSFPEAASEE